MSLYRIRYDGGESFVEAAAFGEAIRLWRDAMLQEFGGPGTGWDETSEPDGVTLMSAGAVIRAKRAA